MYEDLFEASEKTSNRSKNFEALKAEEQADVLGFVAWLEANTSFTQNTRNSYKSYITKAILKARKSEKLTSDERSAVKKFKEFLS